MTTEAPGVTLPASFGTRERYRADLHAALGALITDATETVDALAWDGVPAVTRKALDEAIAAVFTGPIPPPDAKVAEVATPAVVNVSAKCPSCGIASVIGVALTPQLVVETTGAELKIKASSKGRVHTCGQLTTELEESPNGQVTLDEAVEPAEDPPAETLGASEFADEPERLACDGSNHVPGCEHFPPLAAVPAEPATIADAVCGEKYGPRRRLRCGLEPDHQGDHGQTPEADDDADLPF